MIRFLRVLGFILAYLAGGLVLLWAAGAMWFDFPAAMPWREFAAAAFFVGVILFWLIGRRWSRIVALALLLAVVGWWFSQQPGSDRHWQPNVAETAWAEINGDEVTFHNVRNFEYRSASDFTPHWETRSVHLSQLTGIDLGINYWGSPYMAHPLVSFQFADAPPLCFSIETRREVGENYSAIGGFYRQYELIYIVGDERDLIRVRTNYNKGEDIYLYRLNMTATEAREWFLEYIAALNRLHEQPKWYNAATTNCTTSIRAQRAAHKRSAADWRMLINGYMDEMLYERGMLCTGGLPFAKLKAHALIDDPARASNDAPDFSARIRSHLPPPGP